MDDQDEDDAWRGGSEDDIFHKSLGHFCHVALQPAQDVGLEIQNLL